jgi:hypothetical protein
MANTLEIMIAADGCSRSVTVALEPDPKPALDACCLWPSTSDCRAHRRGPGSRQGQGSGVRAQAQADASPASGALARREAGETLMDIARSYNVRVTLFRSPARRRTRPFLSNNGTGIAIEPDLSGQTGGQLL